MIRSRAAPFRPGDLRAWAEAGRGRGETRAGQEQVSTRRTGHCACTRCHLRASARAHLTLSPNTPCQTRSWATQPGLAPPRAHSLCATRARPLSAHICTRCRCTHTHFWLPAHSHPSATTGCAHTHAHLIPGPVCVHTHLHTFHWFPSADGVRTHPQPRRPGACTSTHTRPEVPVCAQVHTRSYPQGAHTRTRTPIPCAPCAHVCTISLTSAPPHAHRGVLGQALLSICSRRARTRGHAHTRARALSSSSSPSAPPGGRRVGGGGGREEEEEEEEGAEGAKDSVGVSRGSRAAAHVTAPRTSRARRSQGEPRARRLGRAGTPGRAPPPAAPARRPRLRARLRRPPARCGGLGFRGARRRPARPPGPAAVRAPRAPRAPGLPPGRPGDPAGARAGRGAACAQPPGGAAARAGRGRGGAGARGRGRGGRGAGPPCLPISRRPRRAGGAREAAAAQRQAGGRGPGRPPVRVTGRPVVAVAPGASAGRPPGCGARGRGARLVHAGSLCAWEDGGGGLWTLPCLR